MSGDFFPYHPRRWRLSLTLAAVGSLVLAAWALAAATRGGSALEFARAGLCAGMLLALLFFHHKLRPRAGWGVTVGPLALTISRPTEGEIEIPWSTVKQVKRIGSRREMVAIFAGDKRVLVSAHLFPSPKAFEAVASAIDEKMPSGGYDA